ncbi:hypothetical protein PR048_031479 [Dryococelus australis]|uniref:Uncharacterized protein n=1 Tax=Dryococelus australis TaxID=614101 RepID=A0ABQ9G9F6_9NEOP|nr:hypothetical protein PR048_031479 [Dryococelus australis]
MKGAGKREIPEKTRRPTASYSTRFPLARIRRVGRQAVQCWDTEIGCAQPARSVYLIFSLWLRDGERVRDGEFTGICPIDANTGWIVLTGLRQGLNTLRSAHIYWHLRQIRSESPIPTTARTLVLLVSVLELNIVLFIHTAPDTTLYFTLFTIGQSSTNGDTIDTIKCPLSTWKKEGRFGEKGGGALFEEHVGGEWEGERGWEAQSGGSTEVAGRVIETRTLRKIPRAPLSSFVLALDGHCSDCRLATLRSLYIAAVAERLACPLPTEANRVKPPAGSLRDFRVWESCRTLTLVDWFSREFPPLFHSVVAPHSRHSPSSALKTSLLRTAQISSLTHSHPFPPLAWSDFGKPWKTEIRMAGPGIEHESSRIRVQRVTTAPPPSARLHSAVYTRVLVVGSLAAPPLLAVWHSLLVSSEVCYWLRVVQGVSNKLRSNSKLNFSAHVFDVYHVLKRTREMFLSLAITFTRSLLLVTQLVFSGLHSTLLEFQWPLLPILNPR